MKRLLACLFCCCLLLSLVACGEREILDRIVDADGQNPIVFGMTPEEVTAILGEPNADGYLDDGHILVSYDLEDDVVKEITLLPGASYRLPNRLCADDDKEAILDRMGDPQGMDEETIAYLYDSTGEIPEHQMAVDYSVQFAMEGDAIRSITLLKFRH